MIVETITLHNLPGRTFLQLFKFFNKINLRQQTSLKYAMKNCTGHVSNVRCNECALVDY